MIVNGDCLEEMRKMETNSISCIVTDPPYGLGFMGKEWDAGLPHADIWKEALRVVKPGGHLLSFGGTRTYHRLTCAIEDSGWEIRDCLQWIYGSGFPKSHNHFGIEGYGTALKPAYEPIIMAMKPCDGTFKQNAQKWGQAGINIDDCRIGTETRDNPEAGFIRRGRTDEEVFLGVDKNRPQGSHKVKGRWPANVLFDEQAAQLLDEQSGMSPSSDAVNHETKIGGAVCGWSTAQKYLRSGGHTDSGGASRFFYCAKTSSRERGEGNTHPTVKPLKLMEYLITLVMPPKDGVLLDPFAGSGSTILAAHRLGLKAIGIEKSPEYCEIARDRIANYKPEELEPI